METGENDMLSTALETLRPEASGTLAVRDLAERIAKEAPALESLSPEQLESLARVVIAERLKDDLRGRAELARIDYPAERAAFLAHAGKTGSPNTARAYASALDRLDAFAAFRGIPVPAMKAKEADDFAYSLSAEGRASASVRRDLAAASSFFSFLERRFDCVRNPFRGTKARPEKRGMKAASFPTDKELARILSTLPPDLRAAAVVMSSRGLRVGALPSLTIRGTRFTARSKGKDIVGELPLKALEAIKAASLDPKRPFAEWTETKIADLFRKRTAKLAEAGTISEPYSVHDLRHFYAVKEYRKDKDLLRVRTLLGHASVQVTETYLRSVGEL